MVKITDGKSLEARLKNRPRADSVLIAARAALRVMPLLRASTSSCLGVTLRAERNRRRRPTVGRHNRTDTFDQEW